MNNKLFQNFSQLGYIMLIGSTIVSSMTALIVYLITKYVIEQRRKIKLIINKNGLVKGFEIKDAEIATNILKRNILSLAF